jgi:acyl-coenzyme A synthetase/AMP-(fatty) acid ligase
MSTAIWQRFVRIADGIPEAPAILQGDRVVTFGELRSRALGLAGVMLRNGMTPGARCLMWTGNSPEAAAAVLATWFVDGIAVLLNDEAPAMHLEHVSGVTKPAFALVDGPRFDAAARALDCPTQRLVQQSAADAVEARDRRPPAHSLEPASIFFTSGSTGAPKGVTQSHATLIAGCEMVASHLGLRGGDRILCPIPWSFDYGYGQLLSSILLGVTQVLPTARNSFALCAAIEAHRPTIFAGLPSIFALLLRGVSPLRQTDLSSLRLVTNTGGPIAPAIFADLQQVFGHCDISLNYGMTETYRSAGLPVSLAAKRPESVGFAYPGVALAILRENGEETEPNEIGEIVHRGAGVFLGYWGAREATAKILRPDPLWRREALPAPMAVFTGDLGWKDADGFLMIKGRRDRQIKSMGVRVSPDEVETMIRNTGLVRDVAIVGIPHELMGEMVVAAITVADGQASPLRALKIFARDVMSPPMQPRVYRVMDGFPLTPNGKTDFTRLRALMSEGDRHGPSAFEEDSA